MIISRRIKFNVMASVKHRCLKSLIPMRGGESMIHYDEDKLKEIPERGGSIEKSMTCEYRKGSGGKCPNCELIVNSM